MKQRVTGIGGFFFKTKDPKSLKQWYNRHLGLNTDEYGCTFWWKDEQGNKCATQWSPFKEDTAYFNPSEKPFMMNFRVADLEDLIEVLKEEGVQQVGEIETYSYGKFAWVMDPEGNKLELWEPIDRVFE